MQRLLLVGIPDEEQENLSFALGNSYQLIFQKECNFDQLSAYPSVLIFKVKADYSDFNVIEHANRLFIPVITIVHKDLIDYGMHLKGFGAFAVVFDEYKYHELGEKITLALAASNASVQTTIDQSELINSRLIGSSKNMLLLKENIRRCSNASIPVCIHGESGTGKEVVARLMHDLHPTRSKHRFVAKNCTSIPDQLFESELFGAEKGAYTGAETRPGSFEAANNGTLFLDEIADLPKSNQPKLLRALENQTVVRLGSVEEYKVDVRLICASHKDLKKIVNKKKFRLDLYYRLAAVKLYIPPLRKRPEDIPLLVGYFMKQQPVPRIVPDGVIEKLMNYEWPGNVRQLINVLERAILFSGERDYITPESVFFY